MSVLNTARSHKFSSDRTILEYASGIWDLKRHPGPEAKNGPENVTTQSADAAKQ
jgi:hypothetical protein